MIRSETPAPEIRPQTMLTLTPDLLLRAYAAGIFPMAEGADSAELMWFDPPMRGILPLEGFHVPRRLRRTVRQRRFEVRIDSAFREVVTACGEPTSDRPTTWINGDILDAYTALHERGRAHSVECWRDGRLVGGLYGVALGAAFFGESMFSRETDASKVALVHLVARLVRGRFGLLDTQFVTSHLSRFGAVEISRIRYRRLLNAAIAREGRFHCASDEGELVASFLQSITQTS